MQHSYLNPASLNNIVTFEMKVFADDTAKRTNNYTWDTRIQTWAAVRELIGRSTIEVGLPINKHNVKITIRGNPTTRQISIGDRCHYRGKTGAVINVAVRDDRGEIIDVLVSEEGVTS